MEVTVTLDQDPERTVLIPITKVNQGTASDADYPADTTTLTGNTTLTIPAGDTNSTGVVTITAVNDDAYTWNRTVAVSGTAVNSVGITDPDDVTLTIREDEDIPDRCGHHVLATNSSLFRANYYFCYHFVPFPPVFPSISSLIFACGCLAP